MKEDICITLYKLGKIVFIIGLIALPLYYLGVFKALEPYNYCVFKRVTGIYCPGCGGTRALKALLSGDIAASLFYHPAVLYFTVFYIVFMLLGQYTMTEIHSAKGRADCIVETDDYVYIFEFKRDKSAEEALKQIEEAGYAKPYAADQRKLLKVGVNFDSGERSIDDWIVR